MIKELKDYIIREWNKDKNKKEVELTAQEAALLCIKRDSEFADKEYNKTVREMEKLKKEVYKRIKDKCIHEPEIRRLSYKLECDRKNRSLRKKLFEEIIAKELMSKGFEVLIFENKALYSSIDYMIKWEVE